MLPNNTKKNSYLIQFKLLGEDGKALYYIDKDLEQLASAH